MELLNVKAVVRENKFNIEAFGVFMSERIHVGARHGRSLRQFLSDEFREGRVPLRGRCSNYDPLKEKVIVTAPRDWWADAPDELIGAAVRFNMIGTIPVSDDPDDGKITVIRLTEATSGSEPVIIFDGTKVVENAALFALGRNVWARLVPPPMKWEDDPDDDDNDSDDEGYR